MRIKQINPRGWYDIPGYDGKYQINYFGNVRRALKRGYKALHPYIKTATEPFIFFWIHQQKDLPKRLRELPGRWGIQSLCEMRKMM